jgi:hypothetical protein
VQDILDLIPQDVKDAYGLNDFIVGDFGDGMRFWLRIAGKYLFGSLLGGLWAQGMTHEQLIDYTA